MNTQKPKNHHFVPECYLKEFCSDGKLFTLDVRKLDQGFNEFPRENYPGKICYAEYYYQINDNLKNTGFFKLEQYDDFFVESVALTKLETVYGAILKKATETFSLSFSEAVDLCDFIAILKQRNPYWMEKTIEANKDKWIDNTLTQIFKKTLESDYKYRHIPADIQRMVFAHVRAQAKDNPNFSKQLQLFGLIGRYSDDSNQNAEFRRALLNCSWVIFVAPEGGQQFITSDNPGFAIDYITNVIQNTKFANNFNFIFPLSGRYCLAIGDSIKDDCYSKESTKFISRESVDTEFVNNLNAMALAHFNSLLIAEEKSFLEDIVKHRKKPAK